MIPDKTSLACCTCFGYIWNFLDGRIINGGVYCEDCRQKFIGEKNMILNPFKCEECERELQPENIGIYMRDSQLVRVCLFCGNVVKVKLQEEN